MVESIESNWKQRTDLARKLRKDGDLEAAERLIRQVQKTHPSRLEVATEAAEIALAQGDWHQAVARWRRVVVLYHRMSLADAQSHWPSLFTAEEEMRSLAWRPQLFAAKRALKRVLRQPPTPPPLESHGYFTACRKLAAGYRWSENLEAAKEMLQGTLSQLKALARSQPTSPDAKGTCFVLTHAHRGWILEKIARVIAREIDDARLVYISSTPRVREIPDAGRYFFMHHQILSNALLSSPRFWRVPIYCFYTHPSQKSSIHPDHIPLFLNEIEHTIVQNSHIKAQLSESGADPKRISMVLGGADPSTFVGHVRGGGKLGFVGGYYERKNPHLLLQLARALPDEQFLVLGPSSQEITHDAIFWPNAPLFPELIAQPNIEYREALYEEFPQHFAEIDIFLMLSRVEGGPIPLLEAMMSNCVPVATDTGFASDLIHQGINGYLAAPDADVSTFVKLIRQAKLNDSDIRATVMNYTWDGYGATIAMQMAATIHG